MQTEQEEGKGPKRVKVEKENSPENKDEKDNKASGQERVVFNVYGGNFNQDWPVEFPCKAESKSFNENTRAMHLIYMIIFHLVAAGIIMKHDWKVPMWLFIKWYFTCKSMYGD